MVYNPSITNLGAPPARSYCSSKPICLEGSHRLVLGCQMNIEICWFGDVDKADQISTHTCIEVRWADIICCINIATCMQIIHLFVCWTVFPPLHPSLSIHLFNNLFVVHLSLLQTPAWGWSNSNIAVQWCAIPLYDVGMPCFPQVKIPIDIGCQTWLDRYGWEASNVDPSQSF